MKKLTTALIILALGVTSCSDDDDNIAPNENGAFIEVQFLPVRTESPVQGIVQENGLKQTAAQGSLVFSSGHIIIDELEFNAEGRDGVVDYDFEVEESTVIDFATGNSNPDISSLGIPAGDYSEVEIEMDLEEDSDEPAILLFGTYTDLHGQDHPVRFEYHEDQDFGVEWEDGILFLEDQTAQANITFDPTRWFSEVTNAQFSGAQRDEDGVILVSASSNTSIYSLVSDGLELASDLEFGDDDDDDDDDNG